MEKIIHLGKVLRKSRKKMSRRKLELTVISCGSESNGVSRHEMCSLMPSGGQKKIANLKNVEDLQFYTSKRKKN